MASDPTTRRFGACWIIVPCEWSMMPGQPLLLLLLRYRQVVADGGPGAAGRERRWSDRAKPTTITVTP